MISSSVPGDAAAVAALECAWQGADAWSPALVDEAVSGALPTTTVVVARDGEEVVGYAVVAEVDAIAELQRIGVSTPRRRQGHARALMSEVIRRAEAAEADRILLEVRAGNAAALALYAAFGFVEVDRRPRYYRDGAEAIVLLRSMQEGGGTA